MRIRVRERDRELGDLSVLRVEPSHVRLGVGGEPDVALAVGDQPVRARVCGRQRIFADLTALWIEPAQLVGLLLREPERAVRRYGRIMRTCIRGRQIELADGDGCCREKRNNCGTEEWMSHLITSLKEQRGLGTARLRPQAARARRHGMEQRRRRDLLVAGIALAALPACAAGKKAKAEQEASPWVGR